MNTEILQILQHLNDKTALTLFFDWLQKMIESLDIKEDMESFGFTPRKDAHKISVNLNGRRVLCIEKIQSKLYFQLMVNAADLEEIRAKYVVYKESENFTDRQPVACLLHIEIDTLTDKNQQKLLFDKWLTACTSYFLPTHTCTTRNTHSPELYTMAKNSEYLEKYLAAANSNQILIERYKNIIRETRLKEEIYKWEKVQQFQGRPNTEAADFEQELKNIKFENLIYQLARGVMMHLAREKEAEYRSAMKKLFDENIALSERIETFVKEVGGIFKTLNSDDPSHHDERTIATLLTYKYPDKYAFYKDSFYQKYCKLLNINVERKNKKYVHYLSLLKNFKENYLQKDAELLELVQSFLPENAYPDNSLNLLAQDVLYQVLDRELDAKNYWIFQCNPKQFDVETALRENLVSNWSVTANKDKMRIGDKVILWVTGEKSGCYALAEITSEVKSRNANDTDAHLWKEVPKSDLSVAMKITHNWVENPIYKEQIKEIPDFVNFKGGTQGTNLAANETEYLAFLNFYQNKMDFEAVIAQLKTYLQTEYKDTRIGNFAFGAKGKNWIWIKDKLDNCQIGSSIAHYEIRFVNEKYSVELHFEHNTANPDVFYQQIGQNLPEKLTWFNWGRKGAWTDTKSIHVKERTPKNDADLIPKLAQQLLYLEENLGDKVREILTSSQTNNMLIHPLNQILYGPPGTGKTFNSINEALAIIEGKSTELLENEERTELTDRYKKYVAAGQVMFTTFHQSMSYEDFIEGIKPETGDNGQVTYSVQDGVFKLICEKAKALVASNFELAYQSLLQEINKQQENEDGVPILVIKTPKGKEFGISINRNENLSLLTGLKLNKNGTIKKDSLEYLINNPDYEFKVSDWKGYHLGIIEHLKTNHNLTTKEESKQQSHVLIIDEINRGNVSQIFGELITLIEDSKRKGEDEELEITLPYSKQKFSVPNNLYIIGTMNTADRSVEALDTALRRRFIFKEMPPKPELLKPCEGVDLQTLLTKINERLAALLSKDHTIGHAYFISCRTQKDLETVFYQKIIPLLQEYFYGDLSKIQWIIGEDFVKVAEVKTDIFIGNKENIYNLPNKVSFSQLTGADFLMAIKKVYETT